MLIVVFHSKLRTTNASVTQEKDGTASRRTVFSSITPLLVQGSRYL